MTVDGIRSWIGSSNWSSAYFHESRNIGLFFHGKTITGDLDRFFATMWTSQYAVVLDPDATYKMPRVAK